MIYSLLGAGRMAHFLAERLAGKHHCVGIYSRKAEAAQSLSQLLKAPVFAYPFELTETVDACLIAVSDKAIPLVSHQIPPQAGTMVHFSGTVSVDALEPHLHRAVCWPVFSIGPHISPEEKLNAVGEGNDEPAQNILRTLADALSFSLTEAPEESRKKLHLAAVVGNNFVNHLLCLCEKICGEAGLSTDLLRPILEQTFARAQGGNPCEAQTGPARRRDLLTQATHLGLLGKHPEWQDLYEAISDSITAMYPPQ